MQSILLAIACMYFVLGSTLEYIKNSEYIVTGICMIAGLLKAYVKFSFIINRIIDWNHFHCIELSRSIIISGC
jgi:hypothetical protein